MGMRRPRALGGRRRLTWLFANGWRDTRRLVAADSPLDGRRGPAGQAAGQAPLSHPAPRSSRYAGHETPQRVGDRDHVVRVVEARKALHIQHRLPLLRLAQGRVSVELLPELAHEVRRAGDPPEAFRAGHRALAPVDL